MAFHKDTVNIIKSFSDDLSLRLVCKDWSDRHQGYTELMSSDDPIKSYYLARRIIGHHRACKLVYKKFNVAKLVKHTSAEECPDPHRSKFLLGVYGEINDTEVISRDTYFYHKLHGKILEPAAIICRYDSDAEPKKFIYTMIMPVVFMAVSIVGLFVYISILVKSVAPEIIICFASIAALSFVHILLMAARMTYRMLREDEGQAYDFSCRV